MSHYQRGLSLIESRTLIGVDGEAEDDEPISHPDQESQEELARLGREELIHLKMENYPQRYWGVAMFDEDHKIEKFFSTEGGEEGSDLWYSEITNDPTLLYAATWDVWGTGDASTGTDSVPTDPMPDLRNVYKSPMFLASQPGGYSEPTPPGSGEHVITTSVSPGFHVTAEVPDGGEDGYEESAEGGSSGPSAAMLAVGAAAVIGGVILGGKGKKRGKVRV